jgi:hypothetical protein
MLDKDQLEALKRQIDEDYRLDMAAIERLYRRFIPSGSRPTASVVTNIESRGAAAPIESRGAAVPFESRGAAVPKVPAQDEPQPQADELTGSLRAMFSSIHK